MISHETLVSSPACGLSPPFQLHLCRGCLQNYVRRNHSLAVCRSSRLSRAPRPQKARESWRESQTRRQSGAQVDRHNIYLIPIFCAHSSSLLPASTCTARRVWWVVARPAPMATLNAMDIACTPPTASIPSSSSKRTPRRGLHYGT